eukprot:gnl/TRDRNA2_/TRDRNA2_192819_c0_seq1.p1 gnl/TRDRNA2_/TRDRNA2_192819_c0~~gnl/TRDRNA2_/TRDRNA2_192819_c0_seq1.p1  ORF type:complete len:311 (-),score=52.19 gnl/TRDRNA2_/TRDRNA2_192819_c0_seq1:59-991(-)
MPPNVQRGSPWYYCCHFDAFLLGNVAGSHGSGGSSSSRSGKAGEPSKRSKERAEVNHLGMTKLELKKVAMPEPVVVGAEMDMQEPEIEIISDQSSAYLPEDTSSPQLCCGLLLSSTLVLIGVVLLALGLLSEASPPDSKFERLAGPCAISSVDHSAETAESTRIEGSRHAPKSERRSVSTYRCWDRYIYTFEYGGSSYQSREESVLRAETKCEIVKEPRPGSFASGDKVICWKLAEGASAPSGSGCGNSACLKIFNPAREAGSVDTDESSSAMLIAGIIILAIGVMMCGGLGVFVYYLRDKRAKRADTYR